MDSNIQAQDSAPNTGAPQTSAQYGTAPQDSASQSGTQYGNAPQGSLHSIPHGGAEQIKRDERMVYIGKKETMNYVLAVVTQFNNNLPEVHLKARGKMISRAVDVAEIVRNRFMPNVKVKDIVISTEELTSEDGSRARVSSIEISLTR